MNLSQPFRELDIERCTKSKLNTIFHPNNIRGVSHWGHVSSLEKGKIYAGGTIGSFQALTGWKVFVSINIHAKKHLRVEE